jgi:KaiC/GvpD/RAD55 family RecA-like ATPase
MAKLKTPGRFLFTGIEGLDKLLGLGIPKASSVLVSGGTGTGKTILALNILYNACKKGKRCIYLSFEESEERLREHMRSFGWEPEKYEKKGTLMIKRIETPTMERMIKNIVSKSRAELKVDIQEGFLGVTPAGFNPDFVFVDSLSAISAVFSGLENYRIYVQQLFRYFEELGSTTFMVCENEQTMERYSRSGIEEFLADGIIVLYYLKSGSVRERAIEVLKLRGSKHKERIAAMKIGDKGIVVYPDQLVFGGEKDGF